LDSPKEVILESPKELDSPKEDLVKVNYKKKYLFKDEYDLKSKFIFSRKPPFIADIKRNEIPVTINIVITEVEETTETMEAKEIPKVSIEDLKSTLNDYETNKTKTKVTMNELISKLKN
jgi:hypothetical protein